MPAYSTTPLAKKLGIKPGTTLVLLGAPPHYLDLVEPLPHGVQVRKRLGGSPETIHLFVDRKKDLDSWLPKLREAMRVDGTIWVSWPKKASGVATDLTEDVVRDVALPLGLVDVKVCAVDEVWSGLKLVVRKELR